MGIGMAYLVQVVYYNTLRKKDSYMHLFAHFFLKKKFYLKFLLMFFKIKIKVFKYNYDRVYQIYLSPYVSICLVYVFKQHTHTMFIFNFFLKIVSLLVFLLFIIIFFGFFFFGFFFFFFGFFFF